MEIKIHLIKGRDYVDTVYSDFRDLLPKTAESIKKDTKKWDDIFSTDRLEDEYLLFIKDD